MLLDDDDDPNDSVEATKEVKSEHKELQNIEVKTNQSMLVEDACSGLIAPNKSTPNNLQFYSLEKEFQGAFFDYLYLHSIELQIRTKLELYRLFVLFFNRSLQVTAFTIGSLS